MRGESQPQTAAIKLALCELTKLKQLAVKSIFKQDKQVSHLLPDLLLFVLTKYILLYVDSFFKCYHTIFK